jgi:ABC-type transport system involved in cytochrome c biogenesis permease subunit
MSKPLFEVVQDDEPNNLPVEPDTGKALDILLLLLKPLSQKTIIALGNLYSLLTVASVFWLSFVIIPNNPSVQQLIGLGGYAAFVIAVNIIVRRK